jgi:hypothetical protein
MILNIIKSIGAVVVMIMIVWQLDLQLSVQSVPMTSKVVARTGEVYSIHYVIKFWRSVLFEEVTRVPGENHRPVTSLKKTLSRNVSSIPRRFEQQL